MKYGASSSIIILDYDGDFDAFRVIKRIEVPKSEYSYDYAVNLIIELNAIYNPSWIYVDRGSGEYQIETLHIYGEEHKETGLLTKVKGFQFKQKIDVPDAARRTFTSEPLKPFMVNQLAIAFEREKIIMSPYDEVLHKQLVDYEIERIGQNGQPVFTSKNEHFVDALGLAYLAFVLEFPLITNAVKEIETTRHNFSYTSSNFQARKAQLDLASLGQNIKNPWKAQPIDYREPDRQKYFKVPLGVKKESRSVYGWGSRANTSKNNTRSLW